MFVASAINARLYLSERLLCRLSGISWYTWFMVAGGFMQLCGALMLIGTVLSPGQSVSPIGCQAAHQPIDQRARAGAGGGDSRAGLRVVDARCAGGRLQPVHGGDRVQGRSFYLQ